MKGTNLGEFEELVLLTIAALVQDACCVAICDSLKSIPARFPSCGCCRCCVEPAGRQRFDCEQNGGGDQCQGRPAKRFYEVTQAGKGGLLRAKEVHDDLCG